jgi:lipid II:glycine glycyltransferase (peptidoglycan interpeptide bridge formation enzyme)
MMSAAPRIAALSPRAEGSDGPESFLQSDFWAAFKVEQGLRALRLELLLEEGGASPLLVLLRRLPGGLCFAYVPHGPQLELHPTDRALFLAELSARLKPLLPRGCLFIRYDPPWFEVEAGAVTASSQGEALPEIPWSESRRPSIGRPLRRAGSDVQPPDTVLVDLRPGEEAILSAMKSKWRYNVRLAEKKGVVVESAGVEAVGEFYELYRATSRRDRIALHPERYYARLFELASERRRKGLAGTPDLRLFVARHEGRALAAIVTLFRGREAVYLYGASSDEDRNLMPAYALQWAAMRAAKAAGCARYDLFGIPPTEDPSHPMAGLYRFKTGFGGEIAHRAGSWDFPLRLPGWALFRAAEGLRIWWYKDFRKRLGRVGRARSGS